MSHQIDVLKEYVKSQLIDNETSPAQEVLEVDGIVCVLIGETMLGIQITPVNLGLKKEEKKAPTTRKKTPSAGRKKKSPRKKKKTTPQKSEKDK